MKAGSKEARETRNIFAGLIALFLLLSYFSGQNMVFPLVFFGFFGTVFEGLRCLCLSIESRRPGP